MSALCRNVSNFYLKYTQDNHYKKKSRDLILQPTTIEISVLGQGRVVQSPVKLTQG